MLANIYLFFFASKKSLKYLYYIIEKKFLSMSYNKVLAIILSSFILSCSTKNIIPDYEKYTSFEGDLNYRLLYPKDFDKSKSYPLTIFLHGIGERGSDNELQLKYVDKVFLNKNNAKKYPSIVVFPQSPISDNWSSRVLTNNSISQVFPKEAEPTNSLKLVMKLMDSLVNEKYVDNKKVYLSGLSNGAMGAFELLKYRPNMFASAVLICGAGDPDWAKEFANKTPVWIAHGSNDRVVHPEFSLFMAKAIIDKGGSPKVTFYENVFHNSWDNVFSDPEYLEWMYSYFKN